ILGVSILVFFIMHVLASDPTSIILGQHATQDQIVALRNQLGLDNPLYIQYFDFMKGLCTGDFGTSLI
ncbi:Dipeptide transport system permease protein DppB, partial [human gut metagenome]